MNEIIQLEIPYMSDRNIAKYWIPESQHEKMHEAIERAKVLCGDNFVANNDMTYFGKKDEDYYTCRIVKIEK